MVVPLAQFGPYKIVALAGRGGMGSVYRAVHESGETFALKLPRLDLLAIPAFRDQFFEEARIAARLSHKNLVPVRDFGASGSICYLVSPWCEGGDLQCWLDAQEDAPDPRESASVVAQIADAINYCHAQGILHLDIKLANIMLQPTLGQTLDRLSDFTPQLADFGMAQLIGEQSDVPHPLLLLGTPGSSAPELITEGQGLNEIDGRADVFSLGVVLFELLYKERPLKGQSVLAVLRELEHSSFPSIPKSPRVPRELAIVCERSLPRDTSLRYQSVAELKSDLESFLNGEPISAQPIPLRTKMADWLRRPARIRQACFTTTFLQCGIFLPFFVYVLLMFVLESTPFGNSPERLTREFVPFIVFIHGPLLLLAARPSLLNKWSLTALIVATACGSLGMLSVIFGRQPDFHVYIDEPFSSYQMHAILSMTQTLQLTLLCAAYPAVAAREATKRQVATAAIPEEVTQQSPRLSTSDAAGLEPAVD